MAIMEPNYDQEMNRLLPIIADLSEQLNQHRAAAASLHAQAGGIKVLYTCTLLSISPCLVTFTFLPVSGYSFTDGICFTPVRDFSVLLSGLQLISQVRVAGSNRFCSLDEYDAELERMNVVMSAENQGLQHDNKQLNALIKEYEQTLETLMTTFRNRAHEVQEHEINLIRDYESALIAKETEVMSEDLSANMVFSASLSRLGQNLRNTMRTLSGEEPPEVVGDLAAVTAADWALERETELARLEKENCELRKMLGVDVDKSPTVEQQQFPIAPDSSRTTAFPSIIRNQRRILGGPSGTVGPYGTYKRRVPG